MYAGLSTVLLASDLIGLLLGPPGHRPARSVDAASGVGYECK
jgi:hypothetical protein